MGIAVDANVLIRRIVNDNPILSPKARHLIDTAKPGSLVLDRLIIEEVGYVLKSIYRFDRPEVAAIYQSLLAETAFFITDREVTKLAISLFAVERPLSFEDCWLLALQRSGMVSEVATFDAPLQKRLAA